MGLLEVSLIGVAQDLPVSFSDTPGHVRTAVKEALCASQVRECAALAEAEVYPTNLHETFVHTPAMICILTGPCC